MSIIRGIDIRCSGVARHTETAEEMVVYHAIEGERELWVRPLKMFCETVSLDNKDVPRFRLI